MIRQHKAHPNAQVSTGHSGRDRTGQDRVLGNGEIRTKMDRKGQNKTEQDRTETNHNKSSQTLIQAKQNRQAKQN